MDFLSYSIKEARNSGLICGIKVFNRVRVSHLMFVDELLFGGMIYKDDWWHIHNIMLTFSKASSMNMSKVRYILISENNEEERCNEIGKLFGIKRRPLNKGLLYLGFHLKENNCRREDWDRKIIRWKNKWSTLGGILVLV